MKKINFKYLIIFSILLTSLWIEGCGFHFRSGKEIPSELKTVYLITPNPYSSFTERLSNLLKGVDIHLTSCPEAAPVTLEVTQATFSKNNPAITTATEPVAYTYTLTIQYHLKTAEGKGITPMKSLSSSRSVVLNAQQIYSASSASLIQPQLEQEIVMLMYNQLISQSTRDELKAVKLKMEVKSCKKNITHS